jgi:hypothetical protein
MHELQPWCLVIFVEFCQAYFQIRAAGRITCTRTNTPRNEISHNYMGLLKLSSFRSVDEQHEIERCENSKARSASI